MPRLALIPTTLVALALALAGAARAQITLARDPLNRSVTSSMRALPVHVGGRVVRTEPGPGLPKGATAYLHQWPGVYFETAFRGDRVVLAFEDDKNEYRLLVDDAPPLSIAQPGHAEFAVNGLGKGEHRLRLEKLTESIGLPEVFAGFYADARQPGLPVRPRARQMEFIGDSGMTGYGVRSSTRTCTKEEVRLTTDTQQAFPALTAKAMDADYQINAVSGRGLVRNYHNTTPDLVMSKIIGSALADRPAAWTDRDWRPQVVVVGLWNDFAGDLAPGEPWKTTAELADDYVPAFGRLLNDIAARSPGATVLIEWLDPAQVTDPGDRQVLAAGQAQLAALAQAAGLSVGFVTPKLDKPESSACDYHASLADHRRVAQWLTAYLQAHPEVWGPGPAHVLPPG